MATTSMSPFLMGFYLLTSFPLRVEHQYLSAHTGSKFWSLLWLISSLLSTFPVHKDYSFLMNLSQPWSELPSPFHYCNIIFSPDYSLLPGPLLYLLTAFTTCEFFSNFSEPLIGTSKRAFSRWVLAMSLWCSPTSTVLSDPHILYPST